MEYFNGSGYLIWIDHLCFSYPVWIGFLSSVVVYTYCHGYIHLRFKYPHLSTLPIVSWYVLLDVSEK